MKLPALVKSYQGRRVLDFPGLELTEGEIAAVIGPNGSGKSTLARLLAGVELPDGGRPALPGVRAGFLPQKSFAFRMSTERNVLLGGKDRERAAALMQSLGLASLAGQSAKRLSGGETAKMALCRLLMGDYEILLLDEPTAAMDMESTLEAERLIRAHVTESGCAALLITHSIRQARRMAEQTAFLQQGRLMEAGETARLLSAPAREETRRFLEFYGV